MRTELDIVPAVEGAAAFETIAGRVDAGLVLLCDHASSHVPPEYGSLGLPPSEFERHIA
jgi:predicted N-formylglutamate amidohydrolase